MLMQTVGFVLVGCECIGHKRGRVRGLPAGVCLPGTLEMPVWWQGRPAFYKEALAMK